MLWGERWEGGSCLGTHVRIRDFKIKKINKKKKRKLSTEELRLLNCGVGEDSLRFPWCIRRSNQSILKEISPEYSLEGLMLKLKL